MSKITKQAVKNAANVCVNVAILKFVTEPTTMDGQISPEIICNGVRRNISGKNDRIMCAFIVKLRGWEEKCGGGVLRGLDINGWGVSNLLSSTLTLILRSFYFL